MASIITILYEKYLQPYHKQLLVFFVFIIFVVIGYYGYSWFGKPVVNNQQEMDMANYNGRVSEAKIMFFTADWCPHCKRAKPEWDKFVESYNGKDVGFYKIVTEEIDCSNGENPKIQEYSIDGYPTLIMIKDKDQRINFDAKITDANLTSFVNNVLK